MDVLNEACKTIIAVNGGAAVAMGALFQAIIDRATYGPVRTALLWGIVITAVGVLLGALTFLFRYFSLLGPETEQPFGNSWGKAAFVVGLASLFAFVIGVAVPIGTAFVTH